MEAIWKLVYLFILSYHMEEEFISLAYFSLRLTRDMFVLYNTYENIIVSLDKSVRIRGVHACARVQY